MMDGSDKSEFSRSFDDARKKTLQIDVERYQAYLDESGMSEAEKREFLEALWTIIVAFVDLGFGVHPVQEVCGKPENLFEEWDVAVQDRLDCTNQEQDTDSEDNPLPD